MHTEDGAETDKAANGHGRSQHAEIQNAHTTRHTSQAADLIQEFFSLNLCEVFVLAIQIHLCEWKWSL